MTFEEKEAYKKLGKLELLLYFFGKEYQASYVATINDLIVALKEQNEFEITPIYENGRYWIEKIKVL